MKGLTNLVGQAFYLRRKKLYDTIKSVCKKKGLTVDEKEDNQHCH